MLRTLVLLATAALAVAQDTSSSSFASITSQSSSSTSAPSSTSSGPLTHTIAVAKGGHTFVPDVTQAEVGDVIEFQFYPQNHSVVRAEYGYPCIPYEDTGVDKVGFFSGFKPVDAILSDPPTFSLTVNDTNPIFFYCGATGSCINYQMVGVINPNATTSLVHQKELAKESTFMLLPGQPWPSEDQNPFPTSSTTSSSAPTATHSSVPAATTSATAHNHHSGLSTGAIAGIAIGAAAVALGAAIALYLCGRNSRNQRHSKMFHHGSNIPFMPPGAHQGHMSYASAPSMNKHGSIHSSVYSSALPGYHPSHHGPDSVMASPPLHPHYSQSDALNPGVSEATSPAHSPGVGVAVPAYSQGAHMSMQSNSTHPSIFSAPAPGPNVHEMAAPLPSTGVHHISNPTSPVSTGESQGAGIMGFIRKSSVSKAGGVERYS